MKGIKISLVIFLLCILVLGFGCKGPPNKKVRFVPQVSYIRIEPKRVELTTELPGRVVAYRTAEIRPQVSGLLLKRLFKEGSDVKRGQLLYIIDPAPYKAVLENAKAALMRAEANLSAIEAKAKRFKMLLPTGAVSKQDYDDVQAALKQAKAEIKYWRAQVKKAQIDLDYCYIKAPISGRISRSYITEGQVVTAYQPKPLATIQELDPVYVDVPRSTTELLILKKRLKEGVLHFGGKKRNNVTLILDDGSIYPYKGTIEFKEVTVDPTTSSVILRMIFKNPDHTLLPGMFVRVIVTEGINPKAILVPQDVLQRDYKGNPFVYTLNEQNIVQVRPVKVERDIGTNWLISSGLKPGDRVIVEGFMFIRPGIKVKASLLKQ